jgi:hypothetical protein
VGLRGRRRITGGAQRGQTARLSRSRGVFMRTIIIGAGAGAMGMRIGRGGTETAWTGRLGAIDDVTAAEAIGDCLG